ncbi:hypothetical protein BDF20DRAFT_671612 [Mycotypha africana]|uniref:uncharacterized protein n=1 Tax=Mycotypha africana TaxID=64632 RepID=UPI0023005324|nr:uncharacterized protein BDF20DRAFT_671612 [Mycotypha africana]KAI8973767.1 hypothetical protein BDF20DRAFT_671612 [Mycotypha africana]
MLNLYIKNLEPHITNHDLSQAFRKFGRIISARVMTNPATGQSKGYGFVSFGRSEEAAAALREMDGVMLGNRSIIVAYHEPRKGRANVTGTCNTTPTAPSTNSNNFKNNSHRNSTFNNKLRYQQQQQDHHNINQNQFQQQENFYANKHHQQQPMQTNHDLPSLSAAPFHAHGMNNVVETIPPNINSNLKELSIGQRPTNLHNASATSSTTISLPQKKMLDAACTNSSPSQSMQQQHSYHTHNSNKVSGPRYSSSPISGGASTTGHSLASLASGLSIQRPPPSLVNQQHPMATAYSSSSSSLASPVNHNSNNSSCNFLHQSNGSSRHQRPTLRRRGSIESVMTESSANIQRLKLEEAVRQCCVRNNYSNNQITEIVDMLLTLKRKDRSICLFNPDFLQKKVQLAIEALATCHDSDDEESKNDEIEDRSRRFTVTKKSGSPLPNTQGSFTPSPIATPAQQPIYYPVINPMMGVHPYHHNNNVAIKPPIVRESKAIPIVAPPSLSSSDNTSTAQKSSSLTKENLVKNEKIAAENPPTSSSAGTSTLTTAATEVDKKITITTPTNTNTNTSANTSNYNNNITTADQNTVASSNDEIETLLNNIENKPVHEKKQLLGDKLFPLVKATGTKQAPKVTIYLLDTIDLQKLAHIMYDTPQLKECVENAFQALQK